MVLNGLQCSDGILLEQGISTSCKKFLISIFLVLLCDAFSVSNSFSVAPLEWSLVRVESYAARTHLYRTR